MAENVKGLNIEVGLDSTKLESGLSNVKNELKQNGAELKKVNKNMKFDVTPLNSMQKKLELLKNRVKLLTDQLKNEKAILASMKDAYNKGLISETKVQKQERAVAKLNDELETTSMQVQKTEQDMAKMSDTGSKNVGAMASNIKSKIGAVVAMIASVIALANQAVSTASDIREEANEAGIAMESFQRLAAAGQLLGVSQTNVKKSLLEVNTILGDIASKTSNDATMALQRLGLNLDELASQGTEGAFYSIIDALGQINDENERLNMAQDIFGKKFGASVLPMVQAGSSAVAELAKNADGIWTEEQADVSADVANTMGDLKNELLMIVGEILPYIKEFIDGIREIMNSELGPEIKWLFDFIGRALRVVMSLLETFAKILKPIIDFIAPILDKIIEVFQGIADFLKNSFVVEALTTVLNYLASLTPKETKKDSLDDYSDFEKWVYQMMGYEWSPILQDWAKRDQNGDLQGIGNNPDSLKMANRNGIQGANRQLVETPAIATGGNTYNVTIYTSASHFSIDEIDEEIGRQL